MADTSRGGRARWPWLDPLLAGVLLAVFETELIASGHRHGPFVLNVIVVAGLAFAAVWRRRLPFLFAVVVGALAAVMHAFLVPTQDLPLVAAYFLLIVPLHGRRVGRPSSGLDWAAAAPRRDGLERRGGSTLRLLGLRWRGVDPDRCLVFGTLHPGAPQW